MANRLKPKGHDSVEPREQKVDRSKEVSRKKDKVRNISVNLMDIDTTIMYYFDKVIKPVVMDNNERIKVPLRYASAERWKSIQKDGFFRTARGNIVLPVIVFKRTSVAKDETIPVDSFDNHKLKYSFERKYTKQNRI